MESVFSRIVIGALAVCILVYLIWKISEAVHRRNARRYWEARRQRGESGFCLHDPATGNIFRVRIPPKI
ncbi:hypothetical protein CDA09_20725 [Azoarcus sp. DN11]|nr:hypothetical protein CDA09_20725 [Azoarcus sp. DN11]